MQIVSKGELLHESVGKKKKNISKCCLLKFLLSIQSINYDHLIIRKVGEFGSLQIFLAHIVVINGLLHDADTVTMICL